MQLWRLTMRRGQVTAILTQFSVRRGAINQLSLTRHSEDHWNSPDIERGSCEVENVMQRFLLNFKVSLLKILSPGNLLFIGGMFTSRFKRVPN